MVEREERRLEVWQFHRRKFMWKVEPELIQSLYRWTKEKSLNTGGSGIGMQYVSSCVIPDGNNRGNTSNPISSGTSGAPQKWLTGLWGCLKSTSSCSNPHQESPHLNEGKSRGTEGGVSWWGHKNSWPLRWVGSRICLELPLGRAIIPWRHR